MAYTYKGVGWQERIEMGGGGGWAAAGRLYLSIGLFGVSMSPQSAIHRPKQAYTAKRHLTDAGVNIRLIPLI